MLKSFASILASSVLLVSAFVVPASAGWLSGDGIGEYSSPAPFASSRHDGRRVAQVGTQVPSAYEGMVAQYASANGIPTSLIHRVIMRESRYNPRAVSMGNYGLMQIRLGTARAMGYGGSASGLLDAETNMTYAARYLAGAYRAAHGNEALAVALYARGYNARPYDAHSAEAHSY